MLHQLNQERIVFAIAVVLFVLFSVTLNGFWQPANLLSLVQNVSILGILGIGMALAIIGRGIDLSMVSTMGMSVAWMLTLYNGGMPIGLAFLLALGFAVLVGIVNGILVAYVEIPAIFATLAMGIVVYGFGKSMLVPIDAVYIDDVSGWFFLIGSGQVLGVPMPVIVFALVGLLAYLFLRYLRPGRFIYGMGDNPLTARITGIPTRPMMVVQYVLISVIALIGADRCCDRGVGHEHPGGAVHHGLRRHPCRRSRRYRSFGRKGRYPQRRRRHASDRHPAQRDDDHGPDLHGAEHPEERDSSGCHRGGYDPQSA